MPDFVIPPDFVYPTEEQWQRAAERGERAVRKAMGTLGIKMLRAKPSASGLEIAAGIGALVAIGEYLRAVSSRDHPHVIEQSTMAYLRGSLRGTQTPVHDDGREFVQASDA